MEELSIEEKAKRYDESIERAKHYQKVNGSAVITAIFPELKESEDDKIRKGIESILKHYKENGEIICPYPFVKIDEVLAWLEKQKETIPDATSSNKNTSAKDKKKYILTNETINFKGHILHRIQAIKDIGKLVKKGDLGGWVEFETNLSQDPDDDCWIFNEAKVFELAEVRLNAKIHDNACIYGKAEISGNTYIYDNVEVYDCARIGGVLDYVLISDNAKIHDNARIFDRARVQDDAEIYENATIKNCARIRNKAKIHGDVVVSGNADITKNAEVIRNNDYSVYRDTWSNTCWYNSYITWTRSNGKWTNGAFYGSDKELIREAYKDSKKSGKRYEAIVDVNRLLSTN